MKGSLLMSSSDKEIALELTKLTIESYNRNTNLKSPYTRIDVKNVQDIYVSFYNTVSNLDKNK